MYNQRQFHDYSQITHVQKEFTPQMSLENLELQINYVVQEPPSAINISMSAIKRLTKELNDMELKASAGYTAGPATANNIQNWVAVMEGPESTPYQGGQFILQLKFQSNYPFKPPDVRFITKIYHPNISQTGEISEQSDILMSNWSPAITVTKVLDMIYMLLISPQPDDPMVPEIAMQYKQDYDKFYKTATEWTQQYASVAQL